MKNCANCKNKDLKNVILNRQNVGSYLFCGMFGTEVLASDVCQYHKFDEQPFEEYDTTLYPDDDF